MNQKISDKSESLIDLLGAQCSDLEQLLNLARQETEAVKKGNFESVLEIVSERAKIGERLEIYGRQTADLRALLQSAQPSTEALMTQIVGFAALTLAQDAETKNLLAAAREESGAELLNLEKGRNGINLYQNEAKRGLTYSRSV